MNLDYYLTFKQIRGRLGMIVPIWFPEDLPEDQIELILSQMLADSEHLVEPMCQVLVCDGQPHIQQLILSRLCDQQKRTVLLTEQNLGKGGAVAVGLEHLLRNSGVEYIITRDADGDHFINDVPNLVRLASQMQHELSDERVVVVGGRLDVHRPMGFTRGEYEILVNDVIWHGLQYSLARAGRVINTQYFAEHGPIPDFHSGFKLYSRESANIALKGLTEADQVCPDLDMTRHGAEPVPIIEMMAAGGTVGQVNRITLETQPVVTSTGSNRAIRYGSRLIWTMRRLGIPFIPSRQLLDNAITRSMLYKDDATFEELMQMRKYVLLGLGGTGDEPLHVHAFS